MDIDGLTTELQIRGLSQEKIDSALKCLVHVYSVQEFTNSEGGGVLAKDILSSYPLEVAQVASELYFERLNICGQDVFRVKWGYDAAAHSLERQLWENASARWREFVEVLDDRYLGFLLPLTYEDARIVDLWKTRADLKWFGVEVESAGRNILRMIDDVITVGYELDLAFGFRTFGQKGAEGQRTLLHKRAYESLKSRADMPPYSFLAGIRLWKFFSLYEPYESEFVKMMKECGLTLEEVKAQIGAFQEKGLTTQYRESQYPPYLVVDKMKKQYQEAVRDLLTPMASWLSRRDVGQPVGAESIMQAGR